MKLLLRLTGFLLLACLAQLSGCATLAELPGVLSQPVDSTLQQQVARQFSLHRLKIKGNVTVQLGTGNTVTDARKARGPVAAGTSQAQDYAKAGQRGGALATAPGAAASATSRRGVPAWLLAAGGLGLLLLGLGLLAYKLRAWLPRLGN
ncbi:MAG: hypothetical protein ACRYFK_07460 [Janthinobacterium lividum]